MTKKELKELNEQEAAAQAEPQDEALPLAAPSEDAIPASAGDEEPTIVTIPDLAASWHGRLPLDRGSTGRGSATVDPADR